MMRRWLHREDRWLATADAEALIRDHGGAAYWEARRRERDVILPDGTTHRGRTPAHGRRVGSGQANRPRGRARHGDPNDSGARSAAARDGRPGPGRRGRSSSRALTVQFRVQFLDAAGTIIQEMHADAWNAAAAIALVEGMEWPAGAVRMVILNEAGGEVQVEPGTTVASLPNAWRRATLSRR